MAVNNLIASSLDISTNNFVNGNYLFQKGKDSPYANEATSGQVIDANGQSIKDAISNSGEITAAQVFMTARVYLYR